MTAKLMGAMGKDNITGLTGLIVRYTEHLHGCAHITIQPLGLDDKGKPKRAHSFDEQRVEITEIPDAREPTFELGIELGNRVRDRITGFEGVVIIRSDNLWTSEEYGIEPTELDKDGQPKQPLIFDGPRLQFLEDQPVPVSKDVTNPTPGSSFNRFDPAIWD